MTNTNSYCWEQDSTGRVEASPQDFRGFWFNRDAMAKGVNHGFLTMDKQFYFMYPLPQTEEMCGRNRVGLKHLQVAGPESISWTRDSEFSYALLKCTKGIYWLIGGTTGNTRHVLVSQEPVLDMYCGKNSVYALKYKDQIRIRHATMSAFEDMVVTRGSLEEQGIDWGKMTTEDVFIDYNLRPTIVISGNGRRVKFVRDGYKMDIVRGVPSHESRVEISADRNKNLTIVLRRG